MSKVQAVKQNPKPLESNGTVPLKNAADKNTSTTAAKPSPVKPKPLTKPSPPTTKPGEAVKPSTVSSTAQNASDTSSCNSVVGEQEISGGVVVGRRAQRGVVRPQRQPPDVPKQNGSRVEQKTQSSHIYQVYDVTAKGLSGKAVSPDHDGEMMVDGEGVVEEHVAMPYTVVDVTLTRRERMVDHPPQLPTTPAPAGGTSTLPRSTPAPQLPTTPAPTATSTLPRATPTPRGEPKTNSLGRQSGVNTTKVLNDKESVEEQNLLGTADDWPKFTPRGIYEDIPYDYISKKLSEMSKEIDNKTRTDIDAEVMEQSYSSCYTEISDLPQHSTAKQSTDYVTKDRADSVGESSKASEAKISRNETVRKSGGGGKTFFQKILKRGGKKESNSFDEATKEQIKDSSVTSEQENITEMPNDTKLEVNSDSTKSVISGGLMEEICSELSRMRPAQFNSAQDSHSNTTTANSSAKPADSVVGLSTTATKPGGSVTGQAANTSKPTSASSFLRTTSVPGASPTPHKQPTSTFSPSVPPPPVPSVRASVVEASVHSSRPHPQGSMPHPQGSTAAPLGDGRLHKTASLLDTTELTAHTTVRLIDLETARHQELINRQSAYQAGHNLGQGHNTGQGQSNVVMMRSCSLSPGVTGRGEGGEDGEGVSSSRLSIHADPKVKSLRKQMPAPPPPPSLSTSGGEESWHAANSSEFCTLPRLNSSNSANNRRVSACVSDNLMLSDASSSSSGTLVTCHSTGSGLDSSSVTHSPRTEKTCSRYIHRALPRPPSPPNNSIVENSSGEKLNTSGNSKSTDARKSSGNFKNGEILPNGNVYEFMPQDEEEKQRDFHLSAAYEDVDDFSPNSSGNSGNLKKTTDGKNQTGNAGGYRGVVIEENDVDYYLQPVSEDGAVPGGAARVRSPPQPQPRSSTRGGATSKSADLISSSYINTRQVRELGNNIADCLTTVAAHNCDALRHLGDKLYTKYTQRGLRGVEGLEWSQFVLCKYEEWNGMRVGVGSGGAGSGGAGSGGAVLNCENLIGYVVKHEKLNPNGSLVIISPGHAHSDTTFTPHINILTPTLSYKLTDQSLGPLKNADLSLVSSDGRITAQVINNQSAMSLDQYWTEQYKCCSVGDISDTGLLSRVSRKDEAQISSRLSIEQLERSICYSVTQILSAVNHLYRAGLPVIKLLPSDLLYTRYTDQQGNHGDGWIPVVMTTVVGEISLERDAMTVCDHVSRLILRMLRIEYGVTGGRGLVKRSVSLSNRACESVDASSRPSSATCFASSATGSGVNSGAAGSAGISSSETSSSGAPSSVAPSSGSGAASSGATSSGPSGSGPSSISSSGAVTRGLVSSISNALNSLKSDHSSPQRKLSIEIIRSEPDTASSTKPDRTGSSKADRTGLEQRAGRTDRALLITARTQYSRTLQRCVRVLAGHTWDSLAQCKDLLDVVLWGPSEDESRRAALIADPEGRSMAFKLWLTSARARALSALVLEEDCTGIELANQVRFLTTATCDSLIQVTKFLFQ